MSITGLSFLLVFLACAGLAILRNPAWGLWGYMFVYYLDAPNRWWSENLPDLRWSLLIAGATLAGVLIHKRADGRKWWLRQGPIVVILIYTVWMWVQAIWAITGEDHRIGIEIFSKYIIVLFLIYSIVDSRDRLVTFLFCHVLGCFYLSLLAWTTYTGGRLDGIGGPGIDDSNSLGMQLATAVICAGGLYLALPDWRRWVAAASIPFALNALVMAGSRGAFLAVLVGGFAMFLARPPGQLRRVALYVLAGVALFGYLASDLFLDRIGSIGTVVQNVEEADQSAVGRIELIEKQWEMAKRFPFGTGHKGTTMLSYEYIDDENMSKQGGRSSHNMIMSSLVDQGFFGLFLWLLCMALLWRRAMSVRRDLITRRETDLVWVNAALLGMLGAYWAAGMFAPLLKTEIYMWLIASVCAISNLRAPKELVAIESGRWRGVESH